MSRSGICAQFGFAAEVTVGTAVTVDTFLPVASFSPSLALTEVVSEGVRACATTPYEDDSVIVGQSASGQVTADVRSKAFGLLLKQILGGASGPTQIAAGALYRQIHTPADLTGTSLTVQAGFPESYSGTVQPFTYRGAKITQATFACQRGGLLSLQATLDMWDEDTATALAADSYPTGWEIFSWAGFEAKIGGTVSTTTGRTTITGGTTIKGLRGVSLAFALGLATDRDLAGGGGIKAEQVENGMRQYTGSLDAEFADRAQLYDRFRSHESVPLEFIWTGKVDVGTSEFPKLSIIYPQAKLLTGTPTLSGPDIIPGAVNFRAYGDSDGVHPDVQIEYESTDTAL